MIFYTAKDENGRITLVGSQADAKAINKDFEQLVVPTDKPDLMAWVQQMLDETINAQPAPAESMSDTTREVLELPEPKKEITSAEFFRQVMDLPYADRSMLFDAIWEQLPLARKFSFASLAMEDGRVLLKEPTA